MEEVDIVDKNNETIGKTTKEEAHRKGLLHRTILAEVRDSKGRWMLIKQADDRQDAGQYVSPVGGHIVAGESNEDALKREAHEEIGYKDFKYEFVKSYIYSRFVLNRQEDHYMQLFTIYSDQKPILNDESVGYRYFTEDEIKKLLKQKPKMFGDAFHNLIDTIHPEFGA